MLEALYPRAHGISLEAANHYDYGGPELVPRSVRWADLEASSAEDEESAGCTATRSILNRLCWYTLPRVCRTRYQSSTTINGPCALLSSITDADSSFL